MIKPGKPPRNWRTRHIDAPLGARIFELRETRGLTRKKMAQLLGVSNAQLQHAEEGENRFSAPQIWQICSILGVEVSEIFSDLPTRIVSKEDVARPTDYAGSGVEAEGSAWIDMDPVRRDIVALAKAARRLSPDQVEMFVEFLKGWKPKP